MVTFTKNFDFNLRRDHQKNYLWLGRREEPILGSVTKNDEKNNFGGLRLSQWISKRILQMI